MSKTETDKVKEYHTVNIQITQNDKIYSYLDHEAHCANNMYNATLFRIRQVMTGLSKEPEKRQKNEINVLQEIEDALPKMDSKFHMPTKDNFLMSYEFLNALMTATHNPDYYQLGFSSHCAQQCIKQVVKDMKSFRKSKQEYTKHPQKFLGEPKLPKYKKSGGICTAKYTNQVCKIGRFEKVKEKIEETPDGPVKKTTIVECWELQFPLTTIKLDISGLYRHKVIKEDWRLKETTVKPYHDIFVISLKFTIPKVKRQSGSSEIGRICAIDLGVNNFAAITNNVGAPCLLFKGGVVKSTNQWFDKKTKKLQSEQTKGTTNKFVSTPEYRKLLIKRYNLMDDYMHKTAKRIIQWSKANRIDTIVVGSNTYWKQNVNMQKENNQKFVQIPFDKFKNILQYLCSYNGIFYVEQEESYTSKASFRHNDPIPVYQKENETEYHFSGKREPKEYRAPGKKSGPRGLYQNMDGTIVNSDLNGSANIGRKAFPELFKSGCVDFKNTIVIKHPDNFHVVPLLG